jgi:hypothetical protein
MEYDYIFFTAGTHRKFNPDNFYTIAASDLRKLSNVHVVDFPLDYAAYPLRFFYSLCFSKRINSICPVPFKRLWFPFYFQNPFKKSIRPLCFVCVSGDYANLSYVSYLKKRYPQAKFVKIFQDKVEGYLSFNPHDLPEKMRKSFDLVYSLSKADCQKFGFLYSDDFISKLDDSRISHNVPYCDVFFAGKAKDRLPLIVRVYDKLTSLGFKCDFYIVNDTGNVITRPGIKYAKQLLPYPEMVSRSLNCACMLDINQLNFDAYTIRFNEAVMYNKKILVNTDFVKTSKYYDPRFVQTFRDANEINADFIRKQIDVNYQYSGDFSPNKLIEKIDSELCKTK